jgi:hypothetical protein
MTPFIKYVVESLGLSLRKGKIAIDFSTGLEDSNSLGIKKYPNTIRAVTKKDAIMILNFRLLGTSGFLSTTSFLVSPSC